MLGTHDPEPIAVHTSALSATANAAERRVGLYFGLAICGVLVGAAVIRLYGISFGLPYLYHWDEKYYFHGAFYALANGGQSHSALLSGNTPFLLLPVLAIMSLAHGIWPVGEGLSRLITLYLQDLTPFYTLGRLLWLGFELLTIWLTYLIGRDALSRRAGLIAAVFLSVAFIVFSEGHYIKGDTPAMLGVVLTAWAAMRLLARPTRRRYMLLGAAIGFALACKAYTYMLIVVPLAVHLLAWPDWTARRKQAWSLAFAAGGAFVAFVVTFPAILVDLKGTIDIVKVESAVPWPSLPPSDLPVWLTYWTRHLWDGLGWPMELIGLAGFAAWLVLVVRNRDSKRMLLLMFPVVLLVGLSSRPTNFPRYTLCLVPFIALAGGDLLDRATEALSKRMPGRQRLVTAALTVVVVLICLPSLLNDLRMGAYMSSSDTRTQAARWIETHLPAGTSIVSEGAQGFEAMSNLGVPVRPDPKFSGVTWAPVQLNKKDGFMQKPLLAWLETYTPTYKLTFAFTLTQRGAITSTEHWGNPDAFVMLSWRSDPEKSTPPSPFWDDLRRDYRPVAKFNCNPCFPEDPYAWAVDYSVLGRVNPMSGETVGGPTVWVYTRKPPP